MRIAFHTPLNDFDDDRISGDRRMARQIGAALAQLGHKVEPVLQARSYVGTSEAALLARHRNDAAARREALLAAWHGGQPAPDIWFTYHSYYKALDLLGPDIADRLGIPYVVAEASDSERRAEGEWAEHVAIARKSFGAADLHLCFTDRDRAGVEPWCTAHTHFLPLPPFITGEATTPACSGDAREPRLITVAMMRSGVKQQSYLALARVLACLVDKAWTLTIIGDGPLRAEVEYAFAGLPPGRIRWLGALDHAGVAAELAAHDIFVWPGLGEAYGLVYLEAQAAGLPVVAFDSAGVPATVKRDETALLASEGDEAALATALTELLEDRERRAKMGAAARNFILGERTLAQAAAVLDQGLALAIAGRKARARPRDCGPQGEAMQQPGPRHAMSEAAWRLLGAELDRWSEAGRCLQLWLRDDDAVAPSPALDRLARLSGMFEVPVLLAVIPMLAEPALAPFLRATPSLLPCQHGNWHRNHAPKSAKKSEFGPHRGPAEIHAEIAQAKQRLGDLLGPALLPIFVPPWNRMDQDIAATLPELGFAGLSCFRNFSLGPDGGPILANTHLDIMDWQNGRVGRSETELLTELCGLLAARRLDHDAIERKIVGKGLEHGLREKPVPTSSRHARGPEGHDTLGLLLHHRDHDERAWALLEALLSAAAAHPAVRLADPRQLFSLPIAA